MKAHVRGMVELGCGFWMSFGRSAPGRLRMIIDYDKGVQVLDGRARAVAVPCLLDLTDVEALEIEQALHEARTGHALSGSCDCD